MKPAIFQKEGKKESEVAQSWLTLCDSMHCSLPGSSVHGIFQEKVLEWGAISFSRRSSKPRDWTWVSHVVGRRLCYKTPFSLFSDHVPIPSFLFPAFHTLPAYPLDLPFLTNASDILEKKIRKWSLLSLFQDWQIQADVLGLDLPT